MYPSLGLSVWLGLEQLHPHIVFAVVLDPQAVLPVVCDIGCINQCGRNHTWSNMVQIMCSVLFATVLI